MVNPLTTKRGERAQITLFIIIGLVFVLLFFLLYFLFGAATGTGGSRDIDKAFTEAITSEPIDQYITSCLETTLQEGLILLGRQGGFIYEDQGSIIPKVPISTIQIGGDELAYLIKHVPMESPWYPCYTPDNPPYYCNFTNNIQEFPELYSYSFGRNNLPFLFKSQGVFSVQEQLEEYTTNNIGACINITSLLKLPQLSGYDIKAGNITADIKFGMTDTSLIIDYPVTVKFKTRQISKTLQYGAKIKVRFRKIYEAVNEMIQRDNSFLDYDLEKDTIAGFFQSKPLKFRELVGADIIKKPVPGTFDNVVLIIDPLSRMKGASYTFQFAAENRVPVLDHIDEIIADENQAITVSIKAEDPDEDQISYYYTGWKHDLFPSFILSHSDIGYHNLTVHASDSQLEDYQTVPVQVCGTNNIGELPDICYERCDASKECDEQPIASILDHCIINQYLRDTCSPECQLTSSTVCGCDALQNCIGHEHYAIIRGRGWCWGIEGCTSYCRTEIVDRDNSRTANEADECGCYSMNSGSPCDSDFDGIFEGFCQGNNCIRAD